MCPLVPGIKRLIPRSIATIAVAVVVLALLPSPAAADHTTKVDKSEGNVCGYSESPYKYDSNGNLVTEKDADGNDVPVLGPTKFLMKFNSEGVCADNTDASGGAARPLTGTTTSALTIAELYGGHGSRTGRTLANWCINKMFESAARVPNTDTRADGPETNTITLRLKGTSKNTGNSREALTWHSAERVLDFDDLVAGAIFCTSGQL